MLYNYEVGRVLLGSLQEFFHLLGGRGVRTHTSAEDREQMDNEKQAYSPSCV